MTQKLTYDEAKKLMIESLYRDVAAHEAGNYEKIGLGYDELDGGLPRGSGAEFDKLFIALIFWDSWIDARNHEWRYYPGVGQSDWPNLAKEIVKALGQDQEITEPTVLAHFDLRNQGDVTVRMWIIIGVVLTLVVFGVACGIITLLKWWAS
jgi:hypothetical protein